MTLQKDIERWAQAKMGAVMGRHGPRRLQGMVRRLLRSRHRGVLPPLRQGTAQESEVISSTRPSREDDLVLQLAGWLCWPSSDSAEYGWGDPYTPANAPLGTAQVSYDETKHLGRFVDQSNNVVHGTNDLAGQWDWRHDGRKIVLSWDLNSIYSGGVRLISGTLCHGACVATLSDGKDYIVWGANNVLYAQECTVEGSVVTGVVGSPSGYSLLSGLVGLAYVMRFNQDGSEVAVVTYPKHPYKRAVYTAPVPTSFGAFGSPITATEVAAAGTPTYSYTDSANYDIDQDFVATADYVDDVLEVYYLNVVLHEDDSGSFEQHYPVDAGPYCVDCSSCPGAVGAVVIFANELTEYVHYYTARNFYCDIALKGPAGELYSQRISESSTWSQSVVNSFSCCEFGGEDCAAPPPPAPPLGHWACFDDLATCDDAGITGYTTGGGGGSFSYIEIPTDTIDPRFGTHYAVDKGSSNDLSQTTQDLHLRVQDDTVAGNFGDTGVPTHTSVTSEATLLGWAKTVANISLPQEPENCHMSALNITPTLNIVCVRGWDVDALEAHYLNQYSGGDIETMLSLTGAKQRAMIEAQSRFPALVSYE